MADLYKRELTPIKKHLWGECNDSISVQIHITSRCDLKCRHCYMYDENYVVQDMEYSVFSKLIDELEAICIKEEKICYLQITGGDPILAEKFWEFLKYIRTKSSTFKIVIMGNSFHIHEKEVKKLKKYGVVAYQISLDGLKKSHDYNRREGAFKDALRALKILHREGIVTNVMFTVTKNNYEEFWPLTKLLNELGIVDAIGFDKVIEIGNACENLSALSTEEYRAFLFDIFLHVITEPLEITIEFKDNLWKLLFWELGIVNPFYDEKSVYTGCSICADTIAILPDGSVQACRRVNQQIAKYPDNDIKECFREKKNNFYQREIYENCNKCKIWGFCRGCIATRKYIGNDYLSRDPYCWKKN